ncbi:MAG: hydrogenase expression/formation protein [Gammaproteobacteria bacterium]|jgi:hydrogenase-1 operon protein HyaF|nr:hydrogenase expression/formation protein [Gammaproteobacteria bacterium]
MEPGAPLAIDNEPGAVRTGNVLPLLHEIKHALQRWLDHGEPAMIDLRSIPMAPGEEDELIGLLGEGEVHARLSALGPSDIYETGYPGVWLVTHYNDNEEIMSRFIEVIDMPSILKSQADDVRDGQERLAAQLG